MYAFVVHVCDRDWEMAISLLARVRQLYPRAYIFCIGDGVDPPQLKRECDRLSITFLAGDRLKLGRNGGLWIERWMQLAYNGSDALWYVRLDPDSWVDRPLGYDPPVCAICGTMSPSGQFIRGGISIYSSWAIARILESGLLHDQEYTRADLYTYRRYKEFRFEDEDESPEAIALTDPILGDICRRLGLIMADWKEIGCHFRESGSDNTAQGYAIRHPVRSSWLRQENFDTRMGDFGEDTGAVAGLEPAEFAEYPDRFTRTGAWAGRTAGNFLLR